MKAVTNNFRKYLKRYDPVIRRVPSAFAILVFAVSCSTVDPAADPMNFSSAPLYGMVYNGSGKPVAGIEISLDSRMKATTDVNGRFILHDVSRGNHTGAVSQNGFEELSFTFQFLNRTQILYLKVYSMEEILSLAEEKLAQGNTDEADKLLSRAEKILPGKDPVLMYLKAVTAWKKGDRETAEAILLDLQKSGYAGKSVTEFARTLREQTPSH